MMRRLEHLLQSAYFFATPTIGHWLASRMMKTLFVLSLCGLANGIYTDPTKCPAKFFARFDIDIDGPKHDSQALFPLPQSGKASTKRQTFIIEVIREWAPLGACHFYNLIKNEKFYDDSRFFRVIPGFMVQFGISGDPAKNSQWAQKSIKDDPVKKSNKMGAVTFADAGPDTRSTQIFINYANNNFLDSQGFAPFGKVVLGMNYVKQIHHQPDRGGPTQATIQVQGNKYLDANFPKLSSLHSAFICGAFDEADPHTSCLASE